MFPITSVAVSWFEIFAKQLPKRSFQEHYLSEITKIIRKYNSITYKAITWHVLGYDREVLISRFTVITLNGYSKNSGIYEHCMALPGVDNSLDFLSQKLQTLLEVFSPTCLSNPPLLEPPASQLALVYWHVNWGNCFQGAALASSSHCPLLCTVSLQN